MGVPANDLEDLLQEVFIALIRQFPEFRYDTSRSFRGWLWMILHRQVIAWRKRQHRHVALSVEQLQTLANTDQLDAAHEEVYRKILLERILQLIQRDFPAQTWQLFWLLTIEAQPGVEVARQFGLTPNAVYLARSRVLARLRAELADLDL